MPIPQGHRTSTLTPLSFVESTSLPRKMTVHSCSMFVWKKISLLKWKPTIMSFVAGGFENHKLKQA